MTVPNPPRWKCIWCERRTSTKPCEHCQSEEVYDMDAPHEHLWSRHTIASVICKQCDLVVSMDEYLAGRAPVRTTP